MSRHLDHDAGSIPDDPDRLGPRSAPRATTLGRLLARLDGDAVDAAVGAWLAAHCSRPDRDEGLCAIAVDDKSLRGSRTAATRAVHLLSAVTHGERATLNQRQVAAKKGEISEFKPRASRSRTRPGR